MSEENHAALVPKVVGKEREGGWFDIDALRGTFLQKRNARRQAAAVAQNLEDGKCGGDFDGRLLAHPTGSKTPEGRSPFLRGGRKKSDVLTLDERTPIHRNGGRTGELGTSR